jgi:hypothetical protein
MKTKLLFCTLFLFTYSIFSQVIYVDQNATGSNNGSDWINAYTDLQTAITNIGTNTTINVAEGIYYPTATTDRSISFNIPRDKKLFGGFPTGGGTRNSEAHPTILCGDIGTIGDNTDNSYHVVSFSGSSPVNEFDGFTVEKGYANGSGPYENQGGGIIVVNNSSASYGLFIRDCIIKNNYALYGGGIVIGKKADIYNCKIYSNQAEVSGGGISINTDGRIYNSYIANNSAIGGSAGGISISGFNSAPKAIGCVIANNESLYGSGAITNSFLINCTIVNNKGSNNGVTLNLYGGVWNSIIWGNEITSSQVNIPGFSPEYYLQNNVIQDLTPFETNISLSSANYGDIYGENYPRFTSPTTFTGNATNQTELDEILNADWSINPQSAAIDFGDNSLYPSSDPRTPTVDIIGNDRTINNTMDAGPYEALTNIMTNQASNQQITSADLNGEILFAETINNISRGFVYATTSDFDVTTATSIINSGTGLGVYSDNLTGLTEDQLYYYRTWVEFDGMKYYGNEAQFKASNLIAYYPFNGNANDESGNENHGTVNGATLTTDRDGNTDSAYSFDGVDNYISVPHSSSLDITGNEITISMWLYNDNPDTGNTWKGISKGGYDVGNGYELLFTNYPTSNGKTSLNIGGGGYFTSSFNTYSNQWIMLTGTFNNGVGKVYINGVEQSYTTQGSTSLASSSSDLYIGTRNPANNYDGFVKGKIDELRIYNKALSDTDVLNLYNNSALGIENQNMNLSPHFYVYNNTLYLKDHVNLKDVKNIEVYNLLGQLVFKSNHIEKTISFDYLNTGLYILKIDFKTNVIQTKKFIIK